MNTWLRKVTGSSLSIVRRSNPAWHAFWGLFFVALFARSHAFSGATPSLECSGCLVVPALLSDGWVALAMSVCIVAAHHLAKTIVSRLFDLAALLLLYCYVLDVLVTRLFWLRISWDLFGAYGLEIRGLLSYLATKVPADPPFALLLFSLGVFSVAWVRRARRLNPRTLVSQYAVVASACAAVIALPLVYEPNAAIYAQKDRYTNYLRFNTASGEAVRYGSGLTRAPANLACVKGESAKPNVIVVVVESLSNYQSRLFSGINDWTPHLDQAAQEGLYFDKVVANGVSTIEGLIAVLTDTPLWMPFTTWGAKMTGLVGAETHPRSLPNLFRQHGYHTAFLTSGDLHFFRKGDWLKSIGFERIEGHDNPWFDGHQRFTFHSVTDEVLYAYTISLIERLKQAPLFLAVETVSTHPPYVDPRSGREDIEKVFRYADEMFGQFNESLKRSGYYDNGILIVLGDHRIMQASTKAEVSRYGNAERAMVPLFMVGAGIKPGRVSMPVQLSDLYPSMGHLLSDGPYCLGENRRSLFRVAATRDKCAYHLSARPRGYIEAVCDDGWGTIEVNGDHTRFVSASGLSESRKAAVLEQVAKLRNELETPR